MYIPVYFSDKIEQSMLEIETTTFKSLGLKERDIEEFLRQNTNTIFGDEETLIVVGQQVRTASRGVSDLTAIDSEGNIVLIEIKRDADDIKTRAEAFEFQAIRYAASYAKIKSPEEIVELVYSSYIEKHKDEYDLGELTPTEMARRELDQFLESNDALRTFNSRQRILLIASSFDEQTLSAVAWLIANNVDISCFTITPVSIGEQNFLNIEKMLPPASLDEFYVGLAHVSAGGQKTKSSKARAKRTYLPRMDKLFEWGLIKPGIRIKIRNFDDSEAETVDENKVRFQGEMMSYNQWGQKVTGWSSINIYEWTVIPEKDKTLDELRTEKMEELESQEV
jgi:hypothetical protein